MRYIQYRGLSQVTNWVKLKFAAMNLKTGQMAVERFKTSIFLNCKNLLPVGKNKESRLVNARRDFSIVLYYLGAK